MKITKAKLKQIIKEELSSLPEGINPKENAGQLAEWLNINRDYGVVLSDPSGTELYRIYEMWFDEEDNEAHITLTPHTEIP